MAKTKKKGRIAETAGFSSDPDFLERARERARSLRMGWSEYVRRCLERDMYSGGDIVIRPEEPKDGKR